MTDAWSTSQQRTHNHNTFTRMKVVWPVRRVRGRKYKFETWQIELAQRVLAEQTKESK